MEKKAPWAVIDLLVVAYLNIAGGVVGCIAGLASLPSSESGTVFLFGFGAIVTGILFIGFSTVVRSLWRIETSRSEPEETHPSGRAVIHAPTLL
jgi:hypothetical protein